MRQRRSAALLCVLTVAAAVVGVPLAGTARADTDGDFSVSPTALSVGDTYSGVYTDESSGVTFNWEGAATGPQFDHPAAAGDTCNGSNRMPTYEGSCTLTLESGAVASTLTGNAPTSATDATGSVASQNVCFDDTNFVQARDENYPDDSPNVIPMSISDPCRTLSGRVTDDAGNGKGNEYVWVTAETADFGPVGNSAFIAPRLTPDGQLDEVLSGDSRFGYGWIARTDASGAWSLVVPNIAPNAYISYSSNCRSPQNTDATCGDFEGYAVAPLGELRTGLSNSYGQYLQYCADATDPQDPTGGVCSDTRKLDDLITAQGRGELSSPAYRNQIQTLTGDVSGLNFAVSSSFGASVSLSPNPVQAGGTVTATTTLSASQTGSGVSGISVALSVKPAGSLSQVSSETAPTSVAAGQSVSYTTTYRVAAASGSVRVEADATGTAGSDSVSASGSDSATVTPTNTTPGADLYGPATGGLPSKPFPVTLHLSNASATDVEDIAPGPLVVDPADGVTAGAPSPATVTLQPGGSTDVTYQVTATQPGRLGLSVTSGSTDETTGDATSATARGSVVVGDQLRVAKVTYLEPNVETGALQAVPDSGTYDGNQVQADVDIQNTAQQAQTGTLSFGDPATDNSAAPFTRQVSVPASGDLVVHLKVDTRGLSFGDEHNAQGPRKIVITVATDGDRTSDETDSSLTVRPRPVVEVHGLNSDASTWDSYPTFLGGDNPRWRSFAVGDGQVPGKMDTSAFDKTATTTNTIANNAAQAALYIQGVRDLTNAQHVDVVAHSMGGLISRYYIQNLMPTPGADGLPIVSHLVMLGTPNGGSPCADDGDSALATLHGFYYDLPIHQLTTAYLAAFNASVTDRRGVPFSLLAGVPLNRTCDAVGPGDSVVPLSSALAIPLPDHTTESILHTSMTGDRGVFEDWVVPHLALGPAAAGNAGTTEGTVGTSSGSAPQLRPAASGAVQVELDSTHLATGAAKTPKVCLARSAPKPAYQSYAVTVGAKGASTTVRVPAGARNLTIVAVADPTVTSVLRSPTHAVSSTVRAGSPTAEQIFRSVTVARPRAGAWKLSFSGHGKVALSVSYGSTPVSAALSLSPKGVLTVTAHDGRRTVPASVKVSVQTPGRKPKALRVLKKSASLPKGTAAGEVLTVTVTAAGTKLVLSRALRSC